MALHDCDNKRCVRVGGGHVYVGTHRDNMDDTVRRKRHAGRRKFTDKQAEQIRRSLETTLALARLYGVDSNTIRHIRQGKTYRKVGPRL